MKENPLVYFRIKTEWLDMNDVGALGKVKTEELVMAYNYTEAETTAHAIVEDQNRDAMGGVSIEIIKTKIEDVTFNDVLHQDEGLLNGLVCNYFKEDAASGVGLYVVTVVIFEPNEKTGQIKSSKETIYMPALSNSDAVTRVNAYFKKGAPVDYVVRDVKFDNAAAIYWPQSIHQEKVRSYESE